jgi:hypothetical protein
MKRFDDVRKKRLFDIVRKFRHKNRKLYHFGFPEFIPSSRGYHCLPLLGGLVLGDLVTLAGVLRMCQCMSMYKRSILHQLTSDLVSTSRGVHALNGLALLESGGGGGLGV